MSSSSLFHGAERIDIRSIFLFAGPGHLRRFATNCIHFPKNILRSFTTIDLLPADAAIGREPRPIRTTPTPIVEIPARANSPENPARNLIICLEGQPQLLLITIHSTPISRNEAMRERYLIRVSCCLLAVQGRLALKDLAPQMFVSAFAIGLVYRACSRKALTLVSSARLLARPSRLTRIFSSSVSSAFGGVHLVRSAIVRLQPDVNLYVCPGSLREAFWLSPCCLRDLFCPSLRLLLLNPTPRRLP